MARRRVARPSEHLGPRHWWIAWRLARSAARILQGCYYLSEGKFTHRHHDNQVSRTGVERHLVLWDAGGKERDAWRRLLRTLGLVHVGALHVRAGDG